MQNNVKWSINDRVTDASAQRLNSEKRIRKLGKRESPLLSSTNSRYGALVTCTSRSTMIWSVLFDTIHISWRKLFGNKKTWNLQIGDSGLLMQLIITLTGKKLQATLEAYPKRGCTLTDCHGIFILMICSEHYRKM